MYFKILFPKICNKMIAVYYHYGEIISSINSDLNKVGKFVINIPILGFLFIPSAVRLHKTMEKEGLIEKLDYKKEELSKGSVCYMIFLFPLLFLVVYSCISAMFYFLFYDNTILFFKEYVKILPFILLFLLLFLVFIPLIFFKLLFPEDSKSMKVYIYGVLLSILIPTLSVPQLYHYFYAKKVTFPVEVSAIYKDKYSPAKTIVTLKSLENGLTKMKFNRIQNTPLNTAKIGDSFNIIGKKSKLYFSYEKFIK